MLVCSRPRPFQRKEGGGTPEFSRAVSKEAFRERKTGQVSSEPFAPGFATDVGPYVLALWSRPRLFRTKQEWAPRHSARLCWWRLFREIDRAHSYCISRVVTTRKPSVLTLLWRVRDHASTFQTTLVIAECSRAVSMGPFQRV